MPNIERIFSNILWLSSLFGAQIKILPLREFLSVPLDTVEGERQIVSNKHRYYLYGCIRGYVATETMNRSKKKGGGIRRSWRSIKALLQRSIEKLAHAGQYSSDSTGVVGFGFVSCPECRW